MTTVPQADPEAMARAERYAYELWYSNREEYEQELRDWGEKAQPLDHAPYRRTKRDFLAGRASQDAEIRRLKERVNELREIAVWLNPRSHQGVHEREQTGYRIGPPENIE